MAPRGGACSRRTLLALLLTAAAMCEEDFYSLLGVGRDADAKALKRAYRQVALQNHPDKVSGSQEEKDEAQRRFIRASRAYEVLSDRELRDVYDAVGEEGLQSHQGGGASGGGSGSGGRGDASSGGGGSYGRGQSAGGYGPPSGYGHGYAGSSGSGAAGDFPPGYGGFAYSDPRDLFSRLFGHAQPQVMYINGEPVLVSGGEFGAGFGGGYGPGYAPGYGSRGGSGYASGYPGGYGGGGAAGGHGSGSGGGYGAGGGGYGGSGGGMPGQGGSSHGAYGSSHPPASCAFPQTPLRRQPPSTRGNAPPSGSGGQGREGRRGNIFSSHSALEHLDEAGVARFRASIRDGLAPAWLLLLYSRRCPHTEAMLPVIEQLAEELRGFVRVAAVDAEAMPEIAAELNVALSPTILRFRPATRTSPPTGARPSAPSKPLPSLRETAAEFRLVPTLRSLAEFALEGFSAAPSAGQVRTPEQLTAFLGGCAPAACGCVLLLTNRSEAPLLYRALTRALDAREQGATPRFRFGHSLGVSSARSPMARAAAAPRIPAMLAWRSASGPPAVYDGPLELSLLVEFFEGQCVAAERAAARARDPRVRRIVKRVREAWSRLRKWLSQTF
jgi:curved DNA-binding protein CbpA/thiol-disulfide isomerase/thioredoxin